MFFKRLGNENKNENDDDINVSMSRILKEKVK